jgi:tRNA uridine 5-carbamoylmethylation protein Kti12
MPRELVVIYGAPFVGKTAVAWELARSLDSKSVVVSTDQLIRGAIAVPDSDEKAELDMAHTQLRLLVANYLKNGYNVVAEGVYVFERGGALRSYESDIDQMLALMRQMAPGPLVVRLTASPAVISERARNAGREAEADLAVRIDARYRDRYGVNAYSFDTSTRSPADVAAEVKEALGRGP